MHGSRRHVAGAVANCLLLVCLPVPPTWGQSIASADTDAHRGLERRTSVQYSDTPLQSVFRDLQRQPGIEFGIDWAALAESGVERDNPVTINLNAVPVETILRTVLSEVCNFGPELGYRVRDGRIVISAESALRMPAVRQTYAVSDLVPAKSLLANDADLIATHVKAIARLITDVIAPDSWACNGGTRGKIRIEGSTLIVDHEPSIHERMTRVLGALRVKPDSPTLIHPLRATLAPDVDQAIRAALTHELGRVSYDGVPFERVVNDFRKRLAINVHVQWHRLEDSGVERRKPIAVHLRSLPAERVLQLILEEAGGPDVELAYEVRDGVLLISPRDAIDDPKELWVFPLGDALQALFNEGVERKRSARQREEALAEVIVDTVVPESWAAWGGRGDLGVQKDVLFVRNARTVCEVVDDLLRALESVPPGGHAQVTRRVTPPQADDAIRAALTRVVPRVAFADQPLDEVLGALSWQLGIITHVYWQELQDVGVERDAPVSLAWTVVPASRVLEAVLDRAGAEVALRFDVRDGVLVVCPSEWFFRWPEVHVHRVGDQIVRRARDAAPGEEPMEGLIQTIVETIEPDSWEDNGGRGAIKPFGRTLVMQNESTVCRTVAEFLRSQPEPD